jgi:phosphoglycerate dehydrogenase-like enzyme
MNLKQCRLLVTPTSYGKNDSRLKTELEAQVGEVVYNPTGKPLTSEELGELLPGVDGYIAGLDAIDANALKSADRLKVIARYGVGFDNVDLDFAQQKNIIVTNTPGANSVSVAELALALMLALARQIPKPWNPSIKANGQDMQGSALKEKPLNFRTRSHWQTIGPTAKWV